MNHVVPKRVKVAIATFTSIFFLAGYGAATEPTAEENAHPPERSVVFQPPSDDGLRALTQLCQAAADVEVTRVESFMDKAPSGGADMLYTRAFVRVLSPIFGATSRSFSVDYPGGTLNGRWVRHSTAPQLAAGDRLILFVGKYGDHVSPCSGVIGTVTYEAKSAGLSTPAELVEQFKNRISHALGQR